MRAWAKCDAERLDVFNGLLVAPHLHALCEKGFVTVGDDEVVQVSARIVDSDRGVLGLDVPLRLRTIGDADRAHLAWRRQHLFVAASARGSVESGGTR